MTEPKTEFAGGRVVEGDHREIDPATGQQRGYLVLAEEERAKGFVRPVRRNYIHTGTNPKMHGPVLIKADTDGCGALTKQSRDIAETYARDPTFYSSTYCISCRKHFPVSQFRWEDGTVVGS